MPRDGTVSIILCLIVRSYTTVLSQSAEQFNRLEFSLALRQSSADYHFYSLVQAQALRSTDNVRPLRYRLNPGPVAASIRDARV